MGPINRDMTMYLITNVFASEFLVWEKVEFTFLARHTEKHPLSVSRGETTEFGSPEKQHHLAGNINRG